MDKVELRNRILESQQIEGSIGEIVYGLGNFLGPMLGFLHDGHIGEYGVIFDCNDLTILHETPTTLRSGFLV